MTETPQERAKAWADEQDFVYGDDIAAIAWLAGYRAAVEDAARAVDERRVKVLRNPNDPSWTEHFAELEETVRALLPPA